jgi:DHA3 family macrolide efflux protein-like MFS transporter
LDSESEQIKKDSKMASDTNQEIPKNWAVNFFTFWLGQAFSILGSGLVGFAFVWYLTEQTGSATILTIGSLMNILPNVIISPIAGAIADRWNRKFVMIFFDSITALFTLLLGVLFMLDSAKIWHIFLAMFIRSSCGQFQWAAITSSTSLMVPKKHLSRIAGANETLHGILNIVAPALGAFLIASMPIQGILFIDVSTAFLAVGPLLFIKIPQLVRNGSAEKTKTNIWQDIAAGWKYVIGWPGLMAIIFLAMLVNFLVGPAFSLLPLVVTEHFGLGAYELGFLDSVFGIGVIVGGLVLSAWGGFKNKILTSLIALAISGVGVLMVGLAPSNLYILALIGMVTFGFLNPIINGPIFAIMQSRVEPEMQGRVFSFLSAGAALASPLGLVIAGPLADATNNNQLWFIIGGILTILASVISLLIPKVLEIGKEVQEKPSSQREIEGGTLTSPAETLASEAGQTPIDS